MRIPGMTAVVVLAALISHPARAQRQAAADTPATQPATPPLHPGTLYMVGYSHLDTQWRWIYPEVIGTYIPATMHDNFDLFEKYPHYIFNWTGANRYRLMKEYYPADFEKVKKYVAAGRWFPAGSAWEESLVDEPSAEAIVREVLYGNEFFRRELGKASDEMMLPDTFGFPASLPTILAHCGIKGFSTAKLTWGSAVGIPFNIGKWIGPDGRFIVAAMNAGAKGGYGAKVLSDPTTNPSWTTNLEANGQRDGLYIEYRYYGRGDRGGAPDEKSVALVEKALSEPGPIKVISATGAQMFDALTPEQIEKMPSYTGDLLLTNHSAGTPTSQAFQKWLNRKNELLADDAERASVAAELLGGQTYPLDKITDGWHLLMAGQFHDLLAGTALPKAIEYTWADGILARNELTTVRNDAVGAVCRGLDTRGSNVPLVVYNPLSVEREDVVESSVLFPAHGLSQPHQGDAPDAITAIGPDGKAVPAQVLSNNSGVLRVAILAHVPSVGFAVYGLQAGASAASSELKVTEDSLENHRYRVRLDENGDVAEIFDKRAKKELLAAPARLEFLSENSTDYPAWNVKYADRIAPPIDYVDRPAQTRIVESGPVRVGIEVTRHARGSTIVQSIRLAAGDAGNRVEFDTHIDWHSPGVVLKAAFPLTVANPMATYNWEAGTIQRGNNDPKKFEVPSHQWFDLTDTDNSYGVSVLEDCKYASDKPSNNTLRLTLIRTSRVVPTRYPDQATQDFGRHHFTYALSGHVGDWREGDTQWEAMRLNQPLTAFVDPAHEGPLGKTFSLLSLSTRQVAVRAVKLAEDGDRIIVRLQELSGKAASVRIQTGAISPVNVEEVDGQERHIGAAADTIDMNGYALRAFSLIPWQPTAGSNHQPALSAPQSQPLSLPFNVDVITQRGAADRAVKAKFDEAGDSLPAEMLPTSWQTEGIHFQFGTAGAPNAIECRGQTLSLPAGKFNRIYLLAAAADGEAKATFVCGDRPTALTIQDWSGYIGLTDNRVWKLADRPEWDHDWQQRFIGLTPGYVRSDPVAWYSSHRHGPDGADEIYQYCYLFKYRVDVPEGATSLTLPIEPRVKVLAASAAFDDNDTAIAPTQSWPWEGLAFTNPPPPPIETAPLPKSHHTNH
jgi:alpha-mannosidase